MNSHLKAGQQKRAGIDSNRVLAGGWVKLGELGQGGNGTVYLAVKRGRKGAFKTLNRRHLESEIRVRRFYDEMEAMRRCKDIPGVLPIIDSIESKVSSDKPWFVMPVADKLEAALPKDASLRTIVAAVSEIADTMAQVHARDISHRDIKPDNLFKFGGRWCVGDFGLAKFDGRKPLTAKHEKLGPMFYIAPEMLDNAQAADGKAADVYSIAKLLWKLVTGYNYPLPGQQFSYEPVFSLSTYTDEAGAVQLNSLLENATNVEPTKRLSMANFAELLKEWLRPRSAPMESKIPLDLAGDLHLIEDIAAVSAARIQQYAQSQARRLAANRIWVESLKNYAEELRDSMLQSGLQGVEVTKWPDDGSCNFAVVYSLARGDGRGGAIQIMIEHQPEELPICKFVSTIHCDFSGILKERGQSHRVECQYMSEGPGAEHAFETAKHAISQALDGKLKELIRTVARG